MSRFLAAMLGQKEGSIKPYSVGAIGRSTRPQHIQDAMIAAAQAKRARRAAKPGASAYALANLNRA